MQDIRKPYSHSRYNRDINSRVETFERHEETDDLDERDTVFIPNRSFKNRRNLENMEMFPKRNRLDEGVYDDTDSVRERMRKSDIDVDPYTPYRGNKIKGKSSSGTWIFIVSISILIIGVALMTFKFNSATITFIPKFKDVELNKSFNFSTEESSSSIAYTLATSTIKKTKTLPLSESKKVEAKASGDIIVYNNFDSNPQKLIKNTRFESSNGKIYRINQSVTVPGKKGNVPGSVKVTIFADSYGAEYNSAPSDFTIPGFKGSPRYNGFYGRSVGNIKGGSSGNMSLVSQSDLDAAKDELALEMTQELKDSLNKVNKEGYVPAYDAITVSFSDNEDKVMSGQTSTYEVNTTGYLILVNGADLAKAIAKETMRDYNGQSIKLDYIKEIKFTLKQDAKPYSDSNIDMLVEGKPRLISVTDTQALKKSFLGKSRDDAPKIVQGIPSVTQIEMSFFPLWLSTIPDDLNHISVIESLPKR